MQTSLEKRQHQVEQSLARALRGRGGRLTRSDAVALAGYPAEEVGQALDHMLATYRSHLAATSSGELLYSFDPALRRRDQEPLRERLARAAEALWRAFVLAFKVAIVVVMVVYFVLFVVLLVGAMFARSSGGRDDRDEGPGPGGGGFGMPLWLLWWMLPWDMGTPYGRYGADDPWRRAPRARALPARPRKKAYQQVFDFVFGPKRAQLDPEQREREILAYIRAHAGRLTAAELVALRGCTLERAEQEATRLMCDYDGEPEVSDDGAVIYVFRELRLTATTPQATRHARGWTYAWEREEQRAPFTGNTGTANFVIGAMNGFNLIAPSLLIPGALAALHMESHAAAVWLHAVPIAFSATLFAVPLGRLAARLLREPARLRRNRRRRLLRAVFGVAATEELSPKAMRPLRPDQLPAALSSEPAEQKGLRRELDALVVPLDGDVVLDEGRSLGALVFPQLHRELAAVEAARGRAPAEEASPGTVVFDSAKPLEPDRRKALEHDGPKALEHDHKIHDRQPGGQKQ